MKAIAGYPDGATREEMRRHLNQEGGGPGGAPPPPQGCAPPPTPGGAPGPGRVPRPAGVPPPGHGPPPPPTGSAPSWWGAAPRHQRASSHHSPLEFVTGQTGPQKSGPPALFPAPPQSTAWGGVSFSAFPASVPAHAPAPPIPQTGFPEKWVVTNGASSRE